ncbi:AGAP010248-PA [Anopheles gambiae str. PEST]|uniref:Zinc finger matrin-type protein 5 n=2 Tax=gambiae species complex TaxID=44542 RepID=A0NG46_ANOGA|nr:zinc finger matrin-type protein 5 [Anopheles coluzzii]EAU76141.1 AGAP010248-PA [Anopheles gambiae str. PEST]
MGRKYYCDYCDKRIQNDYNIIKQHNVGLPHLRAKAEYFQQFKSIEEILGEIKYKPPCRSLKDHSVCMFGVLCRYRHYTSEQIREMQQFVQRPKEFNPKRSERLRKYLRNVLARTELFVKKRYNQHAMEKLPPSMIQIEDSSK